MGPGFDVIGLALSIFLELQISFDLPNAARDVPLNCRVTYEGTGKEDVVLAADENLLTRTALYVLRCHGQRSFPKGTNVHIINNIPLGRGLGSSGAAVVGGVVLANEVGKLGLSKARVLDYSLMVERHPDNVAAALYGGFVGTYLNELDPKDTERKEIPLSEVLPQPAGGVDTGAMPPEPPFNIGHYKKFRWAKEVKCIAIIPNFEVPTADARKCLPEKYSRADMVFNMQRIALLTTALGESPPDADMIYQGMQDKVHQPYRKNLIPGLPDVLQSLSPKSHPGLLGICLSGAGPTILALATSNFESIANVISSRLISEYREQKREEIQCEWRLLTPANDGATVSYAAQDTTTTFSTSAMTYASAGVSIDAGNQLVQRIKSAVKSTRRPGADALIGGFGGTFDLCAAGYKEPPMLVHCIDGVGTKLKLAFEAGQYRSVGIDLVAMNVNDLIVQGAEPLSFLDYYSTSQLNVNAAASFVEGVAEGCRMAGCALVGGETAEMPGMYGEGEFDAAGQATGAIPRSRKVLPDAAAMKEGDVLLGLSSSGPHSNGFSLIRKIVEERTRLAYSDPAPWANGESVAEALLAPTKIYVKSLLPLLRASGYNGIKGLAHITGGGLVENIPRVLPIHLSAQLDARTWSVPRVLQWIKKTGGIENGEFARTFNTGLGMVLVAETGQASADVLEKLRRAGETVWEVGCLIKRKEGESGCSVVGMEVWE
ncbi:MAG: hypothetical protein M1821_006895 [Bathelium mastoideum]|nr:MAG: hypothetical protein M1821_006895 [Bathelium mastoideum]